MICKFRVSFNYGIHTLSFKREFDLPFTPFYGLKFIYDKENEYSINLSTSERSLTIIKYNLEGRYFDVLIRHNWKYPASSDFIDSILERFNSWERIDSEDIDELKTLMKEYANNRLLNND